MLSFFKRHRQMFIMALITSPLLGIYNVTPISLLLSSDFVTTNIPRPLLSRSPIAFLIPASFIAMNAMVIWIVNIWLVDWYQRRKITVGGNFRYLFSYFFVIVFFFTVQQVMSVVRPIPMEIGNMRYFPYMGSMVNNTFIIILIELMLTRNRKGQLELEKANLELEKANLEVVNQRSRYDHLKQQIKPHFLFNALNTLKLLIKGNKTAAENYVIKLSSFLRSSLADQGVETISVRKDLEILEDFMHLQQVRFPNALAFEYMIPEEIQDNRYLPTFTLQVLAENATKHNKLSKAEPLKISIDYTNDVITFQNNINPKLDGETESTGIGLSNLSGRFQILTGSDIEVQRTENHFIVSFQALESKS